jgi:DNA repair exonuclease SbcCD ATPase subunit
MILHSLTLQGCRCFRNPITVGPFSAGLNLLVGPNESGKSTLVEAVARALFERYNAGGQSFEQLRPWGSNLPFEITLEFEEHDTKYELYRRMLAATPVTELKRWEDGTYQRLKQNDGADEFLRSLTLSEAQDRGITKPAQWGVARTLWFLQRVPAEDIGASDSLRDRLQEVLGARPAAPERGLMGGKIEAQYAAVFTGRGQLAQQSALRQALGQLAEAQVRRDELQARYNEALQFETALETLQGELLRAGEERADAETRTRELEQLVEDLKERRRELEQATQAHEAAAQERQRLASSATRYRETQEKLAEVQRQAADRQRELRAATLNKAAAAQLRDEAQTAARVRKQEQEQAQKALTRAHELAQAHKLAGEEQTLTEVIQGLEDLADKLRLRKDDYERQVWPRRADVEAARASQTSIQVEQARLEAVGLSLEVMLERDQAVTVTVEGQAETYQGSAGEARTFHAGQSAEVTLPGVAHLRVRSGAEEAAATAGRLQAIEAQLVEVLGKFACATVDELASRCAESEQCEQAIEDLKRDITQAAGTYKDLPQARSALAKTTNSLDTVLDGLQLTRGTLAQTPPQKETRLASAAHTAETARNEADTVLQKRQQALEQAIAAEGACQQAVNDAAIAHSGHQTTLETLLAAFACATLAELEQMLDAATAQETQLRERVDTLTAAMPDHLVEPQGQLETAREALASLDKSKRKLEDAILTTTNSLQAARQGDPYGRLLLATEEVERRRRGVADELLRAGAVRLVRQLYDARRSAMAAPWVDLEARCSRMLTAITGRSRSVCLTPDCGLAQSSEAEDWVDWNQLSSGAQEQLQLAYRLALGETYAGEFGRQMLVLDDVLVYTDPERHKRILEILKIGAEKLQIFILTSHFSFYRGLVADEFIFDIPTLAHGKGSAADVG